MLPAMQTVLNTLKLNDHFFQQGIAPLDDETLRRRVADDVNPMIWLAGHLLNGRKYLLDLFGDERALAWESKFGEKYDPSIAYPSIADLAGAWKGISAALFREMEQASDDHYAKAIDWNLPHDDKTVRGALLFYMYHEAWHFGQVAYARKAMGMEGLVGR